MEKFPDHPDSNFARNPSPQKPPPFTHGRGVSFSTDQWVPKRDTRGGWGMGTPPSAYTGHRRQQSLSDAIRNIRTRRGSVAQNAHEIADALRAPVSPKLIILCVLWYMSSALTNTSSKSILNSLQKPATLTEVQFAFVAGYCILASWLATVFPGLRRAIPSLRNGIRPPSVEIIRTTLPLAAFQIGGHLLSSNATQRIPVSLVHTIKGLSPLFTVFAYRFFYNIRYPTATYMSLIPLTLGVMLACSGKHAFGGELVGIIFAFLAAIIFVTQNIFSKKLFNEAAKAEAEGMTAQSRSLDKLNLLCYSSGMAFVLTLPIWFWSEGINLMKDFLHEGSVDLNEGPESFDHGRLVVEFMFNGTFHFGQNIMAFVLLSIVSPVTYSVASLIKRVFVITIAIIWFQNPTTKLQAVGIALTFFGLYLYDRSSESKADRKANMMTNTVPGDRPLLPLTTSRGATPPVFESPITAPQAFANSFSTTGDKKFDGIGGSRLRGASNAGWLSRGTRQEDTWRIADKIAVSG